MKKRHLMRGPSRLERKFSNLQGFTLIELLVVTKVDVQGRLAANHWGKLSATPFPTQTPLMLDSMWRGGGPYWEGGPETYAASTLPGVSSAEVCWPPYGSSVNIKFQECYPIVACSRRGFGTVAAHE
jgi:hypothetical protein